MRSNQDGITLLMVVLVTAILVSSVTILWRSASLSYEAAMWYYRAKKQFYASESLAIYGLILLKKDLVPIKKMSTERLAIIYQGNWPKQDKKFGKLLAGYEPKSKKITLKAQIFRNEALKPVASSTIICQKQVNNLKILSWQN